MSNGEKTNKNKTNKNESELVTKESFSAVCALFSLIALLILFTRSLIFGTIGVAVHSFLTGVFGYFAYPVLFGALYLSSMALIGKSLVKNKVAGVCIAFALVSLGLLLHTILTYSWAKDGYVVACFNAGRDFPKTTVTGIIGGLLVYGVSALTTNIGAIVIFSVLTLLFIYLATVYLKKKPQVKEKTVTTQTTAPVEIPISTVPSSQSTANYTPNPTCEQQPAYVKTQTQSNPQSYGTFNDSPAYGQDVITQRPGVRLFDERKETASGENVSKPKTEMSAFSPFGSFDTMRSQEELQPEYENTKAFLFGTTPAENYQKNLIFDPNARVNKRPAVEPKASPVFTSAYMPSYSESYQDAINAPQAAKPEKIFNDRLQETYEPKRYEEQREEIKPMQPIEEKVAPIIPPMPTVEERRETSPYSLYTQNEQKEEYTPSFEERTVRDETPVKEEPTFGFRDSDEPKDYRRHDYMNLFSPENPNVFGDDSESRAFASETFGGRDTGRDLFKEETPVLREESRDSVFNDRETLIDEPVSERRGIDIFDEDPEDTYRLRSDFDEPQRHRDVFDMQSTRFEDSRAVETVDRFESDRSFIEPTTPVQEVKPVVQPKEEKKPEPVKPRVIRPYVRPRLDDFDCRDVEPSQNFDEVQEAKENIISTLEVFKVPDATIASVTHGPTVTRYNVTIPRNISPKKVVALDQSIAISLHSSGVNIYPNYEDGVVSIEVPNKERQFVQLGCMLSGDTFVNAKSSSLMFAMGKDVGNRKVYGDICKMTHLLVAGSSNSGKSVFLGALILSLIYKYSPEELRLILIDPKKTEFVLYNDLPHLMINEIITDVHKTVQSLNWAIGEMNRRYGLFEQMSRSGKYVVNLDQYNEQLEKADRLPKIVIIIDELADLMLAAKKDIEDRIQNLTQKARAAGIHLIVATQRPSADVITGVIKSNLSTRIAFMVASDVDSRVILDQTGAQKLLGKGDFLYTMPGINTPVRVQSAFSKPEESQRVVDFIKMNNEAYYDESATAYINNTGGPAGGGDSFGGRSDEIEPVYIDALRFVILSGSASISMIQRKCSVGYNKAGKIVEWMEDMGYISSFDGAKARKVLITKEEFESKYGSL